MKRYGLLLGPISGLIFVLGVAGLAAVVPGYSHVRQTVSEIGEVGSPAQMPFMIMLLAIALCLFGFALALRRVSVSAGHSPLSAYLAACMAISVAGVGIFAFPHPLHNVFGISELIGYQTPIAFALTWRNDPRVKGTVVFSWIAYVVVLIAIVVNLSSLDPGGQVWHRIRPFIGVAQRVLFIGWFAWCAGIGLSLYGSMAGAAK